MPENNVSSFHRLFLYVSQLKIVQKYNVFELSADSGYSYIVLELMAYAQLTESLPYHFALAKKEISFNNFVLLCLHLCIEKRLFGDVRVLRQIARHDYVSATTCEKNVRNFICLRSTTNNVVKTTCTSKKHTCIR